jgi:hypothetical protein
MEKLEQYISKNRGSFDNEEPLPGHFERFSKKLNAKIPSKKPNLFLVASAAAIAGIIITAGVSLMLSYANMGIINQNGMASNLSPEVSRIDEYYKNQIDKKYQIINGLITSDMKPFEDEINQTLNELGEGYNLMLNDISTTPNNERAAYALTIHYQARLEVMETIIYKLSNVTKLNYTY